MASSNRRKFLVAGAAGAVAAVPAVAATKKASKKVFWANGKKPENPLFSSAVTFGDLVFLSGIGAHFKGDIKAHTANVLEQLEARLKDAGSSMDKVLKVNVYLNDLKDYKAMNEVFLGKFGAEPPVRTTIAAAGGIPGDSLVEIDCIAHL
ncbi:MAG: RidA family protein [Bryobacteraceae bacterium]|nr:RidA family protein [Bryobacteraceae bacterium]